MKKRLHSKEGSDIFDDECPDLDDDEAVLDEETDLKKESNDKNPLMNAEKYMRKHLPEYFTYWQVPLIKSQTNEKYFDDLNKYFHVSKFQIEYKKIYEIGINEYQMFLEECELFNDYNLGARNFCFKNCISLRDKNLGKYERLKVFFTEGYLIYNQNVVDSIEKCIQDLYDIPLEHTGKQIEGGKKKSNFFKPFKDLNDSIDTQNLDKNDDGIVIELNIFSSVLLYTFLSKSGFWHKILKSVSGPREKNPQYFITEWFYQFHRENKTNVSFQVNFSFNQIDGPFTFE